MTSPAHPSEQEAHVEPERNLAWYITALHDIGEGNGRAIEFTPGEADELAGLLLPLLPLPQVAQAVESGERRGLDALIFDSLEGPPHEDCNDEVCTYAREALAERAELREALRLQRERGQRIERVAEKAADWRFSDEFIGQIFRAALSDSGPSKESE